MNKKHLHVWLGREPQESAPPPAPHEVNYAPPNPDGSTKSCGNCALWVGTATRCRIHPADLHIESTAMCNYHVFGTPGTEQPSGANLQPVLPEFSGLKQVLGGACCQKCEWFTSTGRGGKCAAVHDDAGPIDTDKLAVCARFR